MTARITAFHRYIARNRAVSSFCCCEIKMGRMILLLQLSIFVLQVLIVQNKASQTGCDKTTGPAGAVQCFQDRTKNKSPEWATCLSHAFIRQQSAGKHGCPNQTHTYCQYRCSLETSNFNQATQNACTCDPKTAIQKSTTSIPSWCYSPPGTSCNWYEECLEKVHPCQNSTADYALKYAKRFCELYDQSYHRFTDSGKKWIDAVRKCLQVALVPLIRPWHTQTSCQTIQNIAFGSHTCCYTGGSACSLPGSPSICTLSAFDWWRVFWTIKSAFVLSSTSAMESLKGVLSTMRACGTQLITGTRNVAQVQLEMKPQGQTLSTGFMDQTALRVGQLISKKMNWDNDNIDWFPYAVSLTRPKIPGSFAVRILITKKQPNLLFGRQRPSPSLDQKVKTLIAAVENGNLKFTSNKKEFAINAAQSCSDISCRSKSLASKAPSRGIKHSVCCSFIVLFLFGVLMSIFVKF